MRMCTRTVALLITALASMTLAGAAQAADLPRKAPPYVAAPALYNWNGFYIGAHVGAGWGTVETEIPIGVGVFPLSSHTVNGFLGGGQAGYNWQPNQWLVLGVEGQISWSGLEGSTPCAVVFKCTSEVNWLATLAGRIGFTYDRTMLYVKAGAAWADSDYLVDFSLVPGLFSARASDTRTGLMLGAGIEYGFLPNWSAKLEYNYMDFDQDTLGFIVNPPNTENCIRTLAANGPCETRRGRSVDIDVTQRIHLIKFGVNYRFNWDAPVIARY